MNHDFSLRNLNRLNVLSGFCGTYLLVHLLVMKRDVLMQEADEPVPIPFQWTASAAYSVSNHLDQRHNCLCPMMQRGGLALCADTSAY